MIRRTVRVVSALVVTAALSSVPPPAGALAQPHATLMWQRPQLVDPVSGFTSISCVTRELCRAGDQGAEVERWDGQRWSSGARFPATTHGITAMDCASATFCAAVQFVDTGEVSGYRPVTRRADGTWDLSADLVTDSRPWNGSISCTDGAFCVLVDGNAAYQTWDGRSWSAPKLFAEGNRAEHVSCVSHTRCSMLDQDGDLYVFDGSAWSSPRNVLPGAVDFACTSSTFCMAADSESWSVYDGSSWSTRTRFAATGFVLTTLSCSSAAFCLALSGDGKSSAWDGRSWSTPRKQHASHILDVSCASSAFCAAATTTGLALHRVNGHWQSPRLADALHGGGVRVSCDSPSLCLLVDGRGAAAAYNGSSWTSPRTVNPDPVGYADVSCVGGSFCMTVNVHGYAQARVHGTWGAHRVVRVGGEFDGLDCATPTACVVERLTRGTVTSPQVWNGERWFGLFSEQGRSFSSCAPKVCVVVKYGASFELSKTIRYRFGQGQEAVGPTGYVDVLSCVRLSFCMGVTPLGAAMRFDGHDWTPAPMAGTAIPKYAMSCATTSFCAAVGSHSVSTWNGTVWSKPRQIIGAADVTLDDVSCKRTICAATGDGWVVLAT